MSKIASVTPFRYVLNALHAMAKKELLEIISVTSNFEVQNLYSFSVTGFNKACNLPYCEVVGTYVYSFWYIT